MEEDIYSPFQWDLWLHKECNLDVGKKNGRWYMKTYVPFLLDFTSFWHRDIAEEKIPSSSQIILGTFIVLASTLQRGGRQRINSSVHQPTGMRLVAAGGAGRRAPVRGQKRPSVRPVLDSEPSVCQSVSGTRSCPIQRQCIGIAA